MRLVMLSGLAVSVFLLGANALAAEPGARAPIALMYEAAPSCPSAEAFREGVEKRAPHTRVTLGGGAQIKARVELRDVRARVTVTVAERVVAERDLSGESCNEIAEASALLVALFAEREASPPDPPPSPPAVVTPAVRSTATADAAAPKERDPKHFAIAVNPASLLAHRYSVQIEILPGSHHALTLNPFYFHNTYKHTEDGRAYDLGAQNGVGGEVGYRHYAGTSGPSGFFFGPSLIVASFWASGGEPGAPSLTGRPQSYVAYGAAFDVGGQFLFGPGFLVGIGAGVQYLLTTDHEGDLNMLFEGRSSFSPRVLASLGYAL